MQQSGPAAAATAQRLIEHRLRSLVAQVACGELTRRRFVDTLLDLGVGAPMAAALLAATPAAAARLSSSYAPGHG